MEKHSFDHPAVRLDPDMAPQCALHAVVGAESLSLLSARINGDVLNYRSWAYAQADRSFESIEWEVRRLLRDEPIAQLPFGQVRCVFFHPHTTLVPRRLFQLNNLPDYFKLLLPQANYVFGYDEIPELDVFLIHATEPALAKLCQEFFPKGRNRHLALPLLRHWMNLAGPAPHTIFVNFRHQAAQIAVFERRNLLFYNVFTFSASSDMLYYVLLVYDQFRLNPAETPLTVSGNMLADSELHRMLGRFVREIRFATVPADFQLPPAGAQVLPPHCLLDLFCLKNL